MPSVTAGSTEPVLESSADGPSIDAGRPPRWRRPLTFAGVTAGAVALFFVYLRLGRTQMTNSDGAANALQAYDMVHGNPLLKGWTFTDVSFYTTEVPQYALIVLVHGLRADVIHVGSAITYVLLILLAGAVAKGRSTGWEAVLRVGLVLAILILPAPGSGYSVLLSNPDHTGTSVPLLATWLVLDRMVIARDGSPRRPRWWIVAPVIAVLLTWAQIGDPLALFIGALPLVAVSAWRLLRAGWRPHPDRLLDLGLLLAGVASVALTQVIQLAIRAAGGWATHSPLAEFSESHQWADHARNALHGLSVNFGAYFPDLEGRPFGTLTGVLNAVGLATVLFATAYGVVRVLIRRRADAGDRVSEILTTAVVVNLGAYIFSTQAIGDLGTARQIVAVLPLGAALAGRLLIRPGWAGWKPAVPLGATTAVLVALLGHQVSVAPQIPAEAHDTGQWLLAEGLHYGIGTYWASNNITLDTGGKVRVAPTNGGDRIYAYRWESNEEWYDATKHDARFMIVDSVRPGYGTDAQAVAQWGEPLRRQTFGQYTVLVYDKNLLVGLTAACQPGYAPSIPECPVLKPKVPGAAILGA
ncbi:hypothetical protein Val02_32860 [Virgisporangium aliadipatigenens]|uniref:Uncharacterized protein n=1 Tax=Virgisporangium aliadipatigenens TaxID=741659 RepID=A0A8J3YM07_9ACTN|nr:hypothetical protein [Virgisporangium aliadipatigenens]GIJ46400.1 hypothetical protein Val02_32860 [Virgisporangium aliadipatigenens]